MSLSSRALNTVCAALTALLLCAPAWADFILEEGESAIFNFTFASPVPSHTFAQVLSNFSGGASTSNVRVELHTDLDGLGSIGAVFNGPIEPGGADSIPLGTGLPDALDGSFSAVYTVLSGGPVSFDDPIGIAVACVIGGCPEVARIPGVRLVIPEPAPLALIGLGLASLAAFRRREG